MDRRRIATRLRSPRALVALAVAVIALVAALAAVTSSDSPVRTRSQFVAGTPEGAAPVELDTTLYLPRHTPAPAVLLAHGLGGTKAFLDGQARTLARHGYVVLAYTARGFGDSGGAIHLDALPYEVHDASLLVTYLAGLAEVEKRDGKPRIAVAGSSYGGALSLLLAGTDPRIEAVGADITWNDLSHALFPNATASNTGVFKKMWAGALFASNSSASSRISGDSACGRFALDVCAAYNEAASTGRESPAMRALLQASNPATVLDRITAPTLITQGEDDSLFPLGEADANARGIAKNGTPVRVVWRSGGHDAPGGSDTALSALITWLDDVFKGRVTTAGSKAQPFQIAAQGSALSATTGRAVSQVLQVDGYPGLDPATALTRHITLVGRPQTIAAPAGGTPAALTSVPGAGGLSGALGTLAGASGLSAIPGQVAAFLSAPLDGRVLVAGSSSLTLRIVSSAEDATLFLSLRDVPPNGSPTLPAGLVAPLRLTGLTPGKPVDVNVALPAVVADIPSGHRVSVVVSTTDLAYQLPTDARSYTVSLVGATAPLAVPYVEGTVLRGGHPSAWLFIGLATALVLAALVTLVRRRRRHRARPDESLRDVPVAVTDLVKAYGDGFRAVNGVTFRVQKGQVVGLLGPNGAGKTTALRTIVGLITPTSGTIHLFGQPVVPGAAVLARVGAFIEGPGFLPHLTGRENLRLFWSASGRPADQAEFDTALDIAGLGTSVDRRVKTYSHGMKQRLGIAQAMLGLPELLILDEPTNGLDPPQIAEMREVLQRYAETGRTVVVSSHLLAEVEQTCTHVVVMHRGQLVAAGSVAEIAGSGGTVLAVDDLQRATQVLAAAGITAQSMPARRALEDVFLDLVGEGP